MGKLDKFHICPGSHGTDSCPQANFSTSGWSDKFRAVHSKMTIDLITEQCSQHPTADHDSAICGARNGQYAKCRPCRTYVVNDVYPIMYEALILCLKDSSLDETTKHEYRVQIAAGLLSAAWTKYPSPRFQTEAAAIKPVSP